MADTNSKLELDGVRLNIPAPEAEARLTAICRHAGCPAEVAQAVARHLVEASLCGVESHGVMRILQYVQQWQSGYMAAGKTARLTRMDGGAEAVDGRGGIGIPAMNLAYGHGVARARETGMSALAVRHVGHTGRHGAFAEAAADQGCLTICIGGGNRKIWRQVAPHGGAQAKLPTNPWCIGIPGGDHGPVVLDFATSKIAGGWIYAAQSAGALLPEGCVIDKHGQPTRDPAAYFDGGAILPSGGHKGYGLALVGELIGEALLGPATTECSWLLLTVDCTRFRAPGAIQTAAEEILHDVRSCPPAQGFARVDIPGERERKHHARQKGMVRIPERTWQQILDLDA